MNERTKKAWRMLYEKGYPETAIAAIIGNLYAESNCISINLQNCYNKSMHMSDIDYTNSVDCGVYKNFVNDACGYGLAQWTYKTRKEALLRYARERKKSIGDFAMQVNFLDHELTTIYCGVYDYLLNSSLTIAQKTEYFMKRFENPADQSPEQIKKRVDYAMDAFDTYANKEEDNYVIFNGVRYKLVRAE